MQLTPTPPRLRASLSTIGAYEDHVKVVAIVSHWLNSKGVNVTAVYSVKFGGNYGSHFLFEGGPDAINRVERKWKAELEEPFGAYFRRDDSTQKSPAKGHVLDVSIQGPDHPGILAQVSGLAVDCGADVLATSAMSSAEGDIFVLQMKLAFVFELGMEQFRRGVEAIADPSGWRVAVHDTVPARRAPSTNHESRQPHSLRRMVNQGTIKPANRRITMTQSEFQSLQARLEALKLKHAQDYANHTTHAQLKQEQFEMDQLESELARNRARIRN